MAAILDGRYGFLLRAGQARQRGLGDALAEALTLDDRAELTGSLTS